MKALTFISILLLVLPACGVMGPVRVAADVADVAEQVATPADELTRRDKRQQNRATRVLERGKAKAQRIWPDIKSLRVRGMEVEVVTPRAAGSGVGTPTFTPPFAHYVGYEQVLMVPVDGRLSVPIAEPIEFKRGEATFDFADSNFTASIHFSDFIYVDGLAPPRFDIATKPRPFRTMAAVPMEVWEPVVHVPAELKWWQRALMAAGVLFLLVHLIVNPAIRLANKRMNNN